MCVYLSQTKLFKRNLWELRGIILLNNLWTNAGLFSVSHSTTGQRCAEERQISYDNVAIQIFTGIKNVPVQSSLIFIRKHSLKHSYAFFD